MINAELTFGPGRIAAFSYSIRDERDRILDVAHLDQPLLVLHGDGSILPGVARALEGRRRWERFTVTVPPAEGYGERDPALVRDLPRQSFPEDIELEPGLPFETPAGEVLYIVADTGGQVRVDGNPPLAGQTLRVDVMVIGVREATGEEINHNQPLAPLDLDE